MWLRPSGTTLRPEGIPAWAPRLRAPLPSPYVYRSALKRAAAAALDAMGGLFRSAPTTPAWEKTQRIAVLRLDHLGDLLHALPALRRLKRALPQAQVDLWVGPWGAELAGLFVDVDRVRVAQADWFQRPQRVEWPWSQIRALGAALREPGYGAAFELRGDLRHHLALRLAGIPIRAGQALSAGRFLLTHPVRWDAALHEQQQSLSLLDQCGVPAAPPDKKPYLKRDPEAEREAAALITRLKLGRSALMIQAACGTQAKRWPVGHWAALLKRLPRGAKPVLLGSAAERPEMEALAKAAGTKIPVAAGALSLPGLAAFLRRGRLLMSVDSGPAHLAAVQGVPVLALYSATNRASQWAPRGAGVTLLRAEDPPCSPCELAQCPFDNACMRALSPSAVERALDLAWKRTA